MTPYEKNADHLPKSPNIQHESNKKDRSQKSLRITELELKNPAGDLLFVHDSKPRVHVEADPSHIATETVGFGGI